MSRLRRGVTGLLAVLVLAYAGICALLFFQQRQLIYYPQATEHARDSNFDLPSAVGSLHGWRLNAGQRDALIYFGGNAESVQASGDDLARTLPGRTIYLLPYRGYAGNPGTPSQAALVADAQALFDEVRRRHPDGDIAVIGRSLGSGVASQLAASRPVAALVLVTPFDSLANVAAAHYRWLPVRWLVRDRFDSVHALRDYRGTVLILRAGRDAVVPPANTDRLQAALADRAQVIDFPQAGHDDVSLDARYWPAIAAYLGGDAAK